MAGILNNKERVIDFLITKQGKRQMSDGRLIVEYASLTDMHTFYQASGSFDLSDVAEDATNRIFFEATDRHQDILVPETEAGFSMQPFRTSQIKVEGRRIASGTFPIGNTVATTVISGTALQNAAGDFLKGISDNFKDQRILETKDLFSDTSNFLLSAHTASFVITEPLLDFSQEVGGLLLTLDGAGYAAAPIAVNSPDLNLNQAPSISSDWHFNHLPNFKFLPPINMKERSDEPDKPLGDYPELQSGFVSSKSTRSSIEYYLSAKQSLEFEFKETSLANNLISQVYELNGDNIEKLTIIDAGIFTSNDKPDIQVFYVGRMRQDDFGSYTYLNLFTLVFE